MVNNYPKYAAGISYQKAEDNTKHFYNAQVAVDPSDDSMSAVLTKDGVVISELPDGGGGSSDFSTAEVEVVFDNISAEMFIPNVYVDDERALADALVSEQGTYNIILYKGSCYGYYPNAAGVYAGDVAVTGDIEYQNGTFIITGNGTITISYSNPD